jgi:hypothetical protein
VHNNGHPFRPGPRDRPWEENGAVARAWGAECVLTEGLGHRRILRDPVVIERVVRFVTATARELPLTVCRRHLGGNARDVL